MWSLDMCAVQTNGGHAAEEEQNKAPRRKRSISTQSAIHTLIIVTADDDEHAAAAEPQRPAPDIAVAPTAAASAREQQQGEQLKPAEPAPATTSLATLDSAPPAAAVTDAVAPVMTNTEPAEQQQQTDLVLTAKIDTTRPMYDTSLPPGRLAARPIVEVAETVASEPPVVVAPLYKFDSIEFESASVHVAEAPPALVAAQVDQQAAVPVATERAFDPTATRFVEPPALQEAVLDQYYVNNQLLGFDLFVRRFTEHAENTDHELFRMIKNYAEARVDVRVTHAYFTELRTTADNTTANLWHVRTEEAKLTLKCRDDTLVTARQPYEVAEYVQSVGHALNIIISVIT